MNDEMTLRAMLKQEETCYKTHDYFRPLPSVTPEGNVPVDRDARQQIVKWYLTIMDSCDFDREAASISTSCLDRFVSTVDGSAVLLDRSEYQLAALTALYTSVKTHCPQALSPELIAKLSNGCFNENDVEVMERRILKALQWRMNPPTAMDFVRVYLDLLTTSFHRSFDSHTMNVIMELVGYQTNLSILQFDLSTCKTSHIAVASLWNALESIFPNDMELCESIHDFVAAISDIDTVSLEFLQQRLYEAITAENGFQSPHAPEPSSCESPVHNKRMHRNSFIESPRAVCVENQVSTI